MKQDSTFDMQEEEGVVHFLLSLITRFGCFSVCISDHGREFVNALNDKLFEMAGIEHRVSSAYHPQTNGLDDPEQDDWDEHIEGSSTYKIYIPIVKYCKLEYSLSCSSTCKLEYSLSCSSAVEEHDKLYSSLQYFAKGDVLHYN